MSRRSQDHPATLPTDDALVEFLSQSTRFVTKSELIRQFNITLELKTEFKQQLQRLVQQQRIRRDGRTFASSQLIPNLLIAEIHRLLPAGRALAKPIEWTRHSTPPDIILQAPRTHKRSEAMKVGQVVEVMVQSSTMDGEIFGKIRRVVDEREPAILGIYRHHRDQGKVVPTDRRNRNEYLLDQEPSPPLNDKELVLIQPLPATRWGEPLQAKLKERMGNLSAPRSLGLIALHTHGIPIDFSAASHQQAEAAERPKPQPQREDLRGLPLVTIDGEDARDFDDAVYARPDDAPDNEGGYVIVVAIADVGFYVPEQSPLDQDAYKRGNSVYLPDRVVPMLPEQLSNDLCSLRPDEDRYAMAVEMVIDATGMKKSHRFMRALIRSRARLTYTLVESLLNDRAIKHPLRTEIDHLYAAYMCLKHARDRRGTLDLKIPERKVKLDEHGDVVGIELRPSLTSHQLIEEMMILANVAAAEHLERANVPTLFRIHDQPSSEKLAELKPFMASFGINIPTGNLSPLHFRKILQAIDGRDIEPIVHMVLLRSQSQAQYSPHNIGHFGLNLQRYAHFTSPIRRYADLVVHRGIAATLNREQRSSITAGTVNKLLDQLEKTGQHLYVTEKRAASAEYDTVDRYTARYYARQLGQTLTGLISGVSKHGLFIQLQPDGGDGFLPARQLPHDIFYHDPKQHALIGRRRRLMYRLGQKLPVTITEANPLSGSLVLGLGSERSHIGASTPYTKGGVDKHQDGRDRDAHDPDKPQHASHFRRRADKKGGRIKRFDRPRSSPKGGKGRGKRR